MSKLSNFHKTLYIFDIHLLFILSNNVQLQSRLTTTSYPFALAALSSP